MPDHYKAKEFEPCYVFGPENVLEFPPAYLRYINMLSQLPGEKDGTILVYGDKEYTKMYAKATRITGLKVQTANVESEMIRIVRDQPDLRWVVVLNDELSREAEIALLFAELYSFPMRVLRTYRADAKCRSANASHKTLCFVTRPLADTHRARRRAYQTSKFFAHCIEMSCIHRGIPDQLVEELTQCVG